MRRFARERGSTVDECKRNKWLLCLEEFIGRPTRSFDEELIQEFGPLYQRCYDIAKKKIELDEAKKAELSIEEILCMLMYQWEEHPSKLINQWLQEHGLNKISQSGRYSNFVMNLYNCFVKLSRYQDRPLATTYRSIRNSSFLEQFKNPDEFGFRGETWYNFTSVTTQYTIAYEFANSIEKDVIMLEIIEREEDEGGLHKGIIIPPWLSLYPLEEEVVFPPLTVLQVKNIFNYSYHGLTRVVLDPLFRPNVYLPLLSPNSEIWESVRTNNSEAVTKWLQSHPSVNLEEKHEKFGCCLLYSAARYGNLDIVRALVKGCAHIDSQQSTQNSTPLHVACYHGHIQVVEFLLTQGVDTQIINNIGYTPIEEVAPQRKDILTLMNSVQPTKVNFSESKLTMSYLVYGDRLTYLKGLHEILRVPVLTIEEEFKRGIIFYDKLMNGHVNTLDLWKQVENELPRLKTHPNAKLLTDNEICAAYLYTTSAYKIINDFLRDLIPSTTPELFLGKDKTWVSTVLHLNSAIRKLSTQTKKYPITWRGVTMSLPPDFFIPDSRGMIAATEYGFMSTSENEEKAKEFSMGGTHATVFCVKCRAEDPGGYHMGAMLEWCTAVKGEQEILFPPITLFELLKRERIGNITTITVAPSYI